MAKLQVTGAGTGRCTIGAFVGENKNLGSSTGAAAGDAEGGDRVGTAAGDPAG